MLPAVFLERHFVKRSLHQRNCRSDFNRLEFSPVDMLVSDLDEACVHYARVFGAGISERLAWQIPGQG